MAGFLASLIFISAAANAAVQALDLKKAIEVALENSPAIDSLRRELSISVLEERSATARLLPSLDFTATHGLSDSSPRTGSGPWASSFNLGLTENLYDNGVTITNRKVANLTRVRTEIEFRDQRDKLILEISKQFLNFSLDTQLLELKEKQFQLVKRQYEVISKAYFNGMKTKKDFLRFKTQVNRAELDLLSARDSLVKAEKELLRLMGVGKTRTEEDDKITFRPLALDKIANDLVFTSVQVNETYREHAWFRSGQIQKEISALNADIVTRKTLPEWNLSTGVSYGSSDYLGTGQSVSGNAVTSWNALLVVKYNFFDWGIRSRDREVAMQKKIIQENTVDARFLSLKALLENLLADVKREQKSYVLAKELLSMEKSNFEYIEREYHSGKVQYLDLTTGLSNLSDAQVKFYSAAAGLEATKLTLLYHQGKLYDEVRK